METTLFNYYFDEGRENHPDAVRLFEDIAAGKYEAVTSLYVVDELEKAPSEKRDKMIALIEQYCITALALKFQNPIDKQNPAAYISNS